MGIKDKLQILVKNVIEIENKMKESKKSANETAENLGFKINWETGEIK